MIGRLTIRQSWLAVAAIAVAAAGLPALTADPYVLTVAIQALVMAVFCMSWSLAAGQAGIKSLGHQAFFGLGAYASALFAMDLGVSPWAGLLLGAATGAIAATLLGVLVLRLRIQAYAAVGTLAFAEICRISAANFKDLTQGELGLWGIPGFPSLHIPWLGDVAFGPDDLAHSYAIILLLFMLTLVSFALIVLSRYGLLLRAMRDAPAAAEACGMSLPRYKILVLAWGGFCLGAAGAFSAHNLKIISPSSVLSLDLTVATIAMSIVGGMYSVFGPVVGAVSLTVIGELLRPLGDFRMIVNGAIILAWIVGPPLLRQASARVSAQRRKLGFRPT